MNVGTLFAALSLDSKGFEKGLDTAGIKLGKFGKVAALGLAAVAIGVAGALAGSASAAIDFESAFAGVRKTVDATEAQFGELEVGIRQMATEMPITANEIAGVAEAAGQLGIKREAILGFSDVMSKLGVTTNLTADEAATSLARIANITQMPQDSFDRLGSTIVALGNAGASTEAELVDMALRIAGAGHQVGMSEAEILSFANSLSSVGIEAAAGGSAISRVMIDMATNVAQGGDKLQGFARVAGMTSEEFATAFKTNAAGAIVTFIEGLGKMSDQGQDVFTVLEDLGLSEVRVRDALLRAAGAGDLFRESMELGNKAWEENNALNEEAQKRFDTTSSKIQVMWNKITDLAITIGNALLPVINVIVDGIGNFAEGLTKLGDLIEWLSPGLTVLGTIIAVALLPATVAWAAAAIAAAGGIIIAFAPVILTFGAVALAVVAISGAINELAMDFGDMGDRIHAIADESKTDFNDVKEWIKARMEETGESFEEAAKAADEHFGTMTMSAREMAVESGRAWEDYQKQITGQVEPTAQATGAMGDEFTDLEDTINEELDAANEDVKTFVQQMIADIQAAEDPVKAAGEAAADALIEPIKTAHEITSLETELASKDMRDNLNSEDENIRRDAEMRTNEIIAELVRLKNEQATQGDETAQIAKTRSLLTSDFMKEGLASNDEEIKATFRNWKEELETRVRDMERAARNARIGDELAAAISSRSAAALQAARTMASQIKGVFPSSEPKDPRSPFRGITRGWGFGHVLEEGFKASFAGVDLGAMMRARLPDPAGMIREPSLSAGTMAVAAMNYESAQRNSEVRDNEPVESVVVNMNVQQREVVDEYDLGLETRRAVRLGLRRRAGASA